MAVNGAILRACARRRAALIRDARLTLSRTGRDLLEQAIVLSYILQICDTDARAEQALHDLAERTDRVGEAARQLRSSVQAPPERARAARRRAQTTRAS